MVGNTASYSGGFRVRMSARKLVKYVKTFFVVFLISQNMLGWHFKIGHALLSYRPQSIHPAI
jgi:hypothetical protein